MDRVNSKMLLTTVTPKSLSNCMWNSEKKHDSPDIPLSYHQCLPNLLSQPPRDEIQATSHPADLRGEIVHRHVRRRFRDLCARLCTCDRVFWWGSASGRCRCGWRVIFPWSDEGKAEAFFRGNLVQLNLVSCGPLFYPLLVKASR